MDSVNRTATWLGLREHAVYRLINDGELVAYKFGRVIRLRRSDVEAY